MNLHWLGLDERLTPQNEADLRAFAALMAACVDGLAIQALLRPETFDMERAFRVLQYMLEHCMDQFVNSLDTR